MTEIIHELYTDAESLINELVELLSNRKVIRRNEKMFFKKCDTPMGLNNLIKETIEDLLHIIDRISFHSRDQDSVDNLKIQCAKRIEKILVVSYNKAIPANWTDNEINLYNQFKGVQEEAKVSLLNGLKPEKGAIYKHRGKKFVWLGNQRQLVELFDSLMKNGWIDKEKNISQKVQTIPILDMFNFSKNGNVVPINEGSFNVEWKGYNEGDNRTRLKHAYKPVFSGIPENKTSKK